MIGGFVYRQIIKGRILTVYPQNQEIDHQFLKNP